MKGYGNRTLVGNWWEERQNLEAYVKHPVDIKDMTIDMHISAKDINPKIEYNDKTPMKSAYSIDTDPARLEEQRRLHQRLQRREQLKIITGAPTGSNIPTSTMGQLSTQFIDPHKTRYNTIYRKAYNNPEFEKIRSQRMATQKPQESFHTAFKETMDLSWDP